MAEASSSPEPSTAAAAQRRPAVLLCARESEAPGLHLSTYDKHWGIQPGRRGHSSPPTPSPECVTARDFRQIPRGPPGAVASAANSAETCNCITSGQPFFAFYLP